MAVPWPAGAAAGGGADAAMGAAGALEPTKAAAAAGSSSRLRGLPETGLINVWPIAGFAASGLQGIAACPRI